jgi:ABC-type multidrug transport system permease subunit
MYSKWLNPDQDHEEIADQITTHALSSNLFTIIPFLGDLIQSGLYYFLLYAGLRSNLGASRSLAWVILLTPTVLAMMALTGFVFIIFCLVS